MNSAIKVEVDPAIAEPEREPESLLTTVTEGYERWAPVYDRDPNPLLAREERHLVPLLEGLHPNRILDLACGTGRWLEKLLARGAATGVGVDRSTAMLRVAGAKDAIRGRLAGGDCESLPFRTAAFDLAICSFALGHVQELRSMARELARVMQPGADAFVSDLHPEAHARGWRVGFRTSGNAIQIESVPRSVDEIIQAFGSSGFGCVQHDSLWLGEPERPVFLRAGRSHAFEGACQLPAILVCHFKRAQS